MSGRVRVTISTPFLNAQRFLGEAIESVFAQTFGDWELLLVNDGSSDGSTQIAQRWAKRFPSKVRYIYHPGHENRGISASHNLAIREAAGDYIAFLDADDVWLPQKLERQLTLLERHPRAMMLYGQTRYWYSWTGNTEDFSRDLLIEPGIEPDTIVEPPSLLTRFLRQQIPVPCPSDVIVRRAAVLASGGFEESFRRIFTDQAFYTKLCLRVPVLIAGESWSRYRRHSESAVAMMRRRGQLRAARLDYLRWLDGYLKSQCIENRELRRALRAAHFNCRHPGLARLQRDLNYRALTASEALRSLARRCLPAPMIRWLRAQNSR
jgi:glycosyltransferase involved in cell wall biosynthesis